MDYLIFIDIKSKESGHIFTKEVQIPVELYSQQKIYFLKSFNENQCNNVIKISTRKEDENNKKIVYQY
jgi:hypothetical protein